MPTSARATTPPRCDKSSSSTLTRRQYECERKRRYRADQRSQRDFLLAEIELLQRTLHRELSMPQQQQRVWADVVRRYEADAAQRTEQNRRLRDQVHRQQVLLRMLHAWVGISVDRSLREGLPWLHSTLLAHPTARQYGFKWLLDRIFNSATTAYGCDGSVEDVSRLDVHVDENQDIIGMECHHHTTFLADLADVAACYTDALRENVRSDVSRVETVLGNGEWTYSRVYDTVLGTSMCTLSRTYFLPTRVVNVCAFIRDDECFPLQPNELRPHGFGWTVMESVTDSITLSRSAIMQYAPVTTDGVLSFERTANMFGAEPNASRDVLIARIENNALRNFVARRKFITADLERRLERRMQSPSSCEQL